MKKMKKGIILSALAGCLLATGCGRSSEKADGFTSRVDLEGYEYDCIVELPDSLVTDGEGGKYVRFRGQGMLPSQVGGKKIASVRDSLMRLGGISMADRTGALPLLKEGYRLTRLDPEKISGCSERYNQLAVTLVTPRIVVWRDYVYSYLCGSAHGLYNTTYVNYSIPDGKILELTDIFKKGYEKELLSLIVERLKEDEVELSVKPEEVGIPSDFEIIESGIRFVWGLYEIAPYVEGEVTVDIATYEITDLLKPGVEEMLYGRTDN
ncbi:MAG: RsiV family protein [Muribaculaceae bacterium]|nr:RsiV family protein [Muribaculaceae bacterium]